MKHYAVIGHPIGHTMSPFIHKRLFELNSVSADYSVFDISPQYLADDFQNKLKRLDGFNVTIPHKQLIIPMLNSLDSRAKLYGSVNTVDCSGYKGYTTDPDGFVKALNSENISLSGRIVILGCGGVARVMAFKAARSGADLTFAIRAEDRAACSALIEDIHKNFPSAHTGVCLINEIGGDIDLLINATPIGMFPNHSVCPVSDKVLSHCAAVFDAVYNPLNTILVQKAAANGGKALGGMSMLVYQAAAAQTIWLGSAFGKEDIDEICRAASAELANK